jgi:hypothetical protein
MGPDEERCQFMSPHLPTTAKEPGSGRFLASTVSQQVSLRLEQGVVRD